MPSGNTGLDLLCWAAEMPSWDAATDNGLDPGGQLKHPPGLQGQPLDLTQKYPPGLQEQMLDLTWSALLGCTDKLRD